MRRCVTSGLRCVLQQSRHVGGTVVDWGSIEGYTLEDRGPKKQEFSNAEESLSAFCWGMQPTDIAFEEALKAIDSSSGPATLKSLVTSRGAPHPADVLVKLQTRHGGTRLNDHALCILLLRCRELITQENHIQGKRAQLNKARTLFYEALSFKHDVGSSTNSALIMCLCAGSRADVAEKTLSSMAKLKMSVPPQAFIAMIDAYTHKGSHNMPRAWELFEQMVADATFNKDDAEGIRKSLSMAACSLLRGAALAKSHADCEQVWNLVVKKWDVKPTLFMYTQYIRALGAVGHCGQAIDVLQEMKTEGVDPNAFTYAALLSGLGGEAEDTEYAESLVAEMREANIPCGVQVYTALLKVYQRAGDVVGMKHVYRRMRKAGVVPNGYTWSVLLNACVKTSRHPNDGFGRLIVGLWDKVANGIITYHLRGQFPGEQRQLDTTFFKLPPKEPYSNVNVINLLWALSANRERDAVVAIAERVRKDEVLFSLKYFTPVCKALETVGATKELERYQAESAAKIESYQERVIQSTLPRHAAARSGLLNSTRPSDEAS